MLPEESLWPSQGHTGGPGLSSATFCEQLRRHLKKAGIAPAGVHIFRHTAAKLRRDAGESVEDVSRFLDHSSLAVTTTYLRRLEGQEDRGWERGGRGDRGLTFPVGSRQSLEVVTPFAPYRQLPAPARMRA